MSQTASQRPRRIVLAVAAVLAVAVAAFAAWRLTGGDDDKATPLPVRSSTAATPTPAPTATESTKTPKPEPTASPTCEGPDTQFNVSGTEQDSLLPDCGTTPVTKAEQKKSGLGLACGGSYPVILYKTTTLEGQATSICGKDSSGESFRLVTKPKGGETIDTKGQYDPDRDEFVGRKDGTTYAVEAYSGDLLVTKGGTTTRQTSDGDWISLDNESDYD